MAYCKIANGNLVFPYLIERKEPELHLQTFSQPFSQETNRTVITLMDDIYVFECPHCACIVTVNKNELNCQIFRHGYFYEKDEKGNITLTQQMNPHSPKEECDSLFASGKIVGCGKPFRITGNPGDYKVEICDYI